MALVDTRRALGAVSELLDAQLSTRTSAMSVDVGRPESAVGSGGPKFNLFLYQVEVDGNLMNQSLDRGQSPPLWLVLKYLLTAIDQTNETDTADAHSLLGEGMLALKELNFLRPVSAPLVDNPEPLKVSFDIADSELLSKVMQGTDEKYRVSIAFQVRPVMIAPGKPPAYSIPVKTVGPPGDEGVVVLPALGARLTSVVPESAVAGSELTISGEGINASATEVRLGGQSFPITAAQIGQITTLIPLTTSLSAATYSLCVITDLGAGREIASDSIQIKLLPEVQNANASGLVSVAAGVHGDLTITGTLLGAPEDNILVAFYREGEVALMVEAAGTLAQTELTVSVSVDDAIPAGNYFIILRINGVQAIDAPEVVWS